MPSTDEIVERWRREVCLQTLTVDPNNEFTWEGIWRGFVIGAGRSDLANYSDYKQLGFPEEANENTSHS